VVVVVKCLLVAVKREEDVLAVEYKYQLVVKAQDKEKSGQVNVPSNFWSA
jgi:hypothetical protein